MNKPLILPGGVDINPTRYGQQPLKWTQTPSDRRDEVEFKAAEKATAEGRPIVGICRGAQLLCILNGGSLIQHSEPIKQDHSIITADGQVFAEVIASHHQIMNPSFKEEGGKYEILAWNPSPTRIWYDQSAWEVGVAMPEVIWWPEKRHLAIQPHPEWAHDNDPFKQWINKLLEGFEIDYQF